MKEPAASTVMNGRNPRHPRAKKSEEGRAMRELKSEDMLCAHAAPAETARRACPSQALREVGERASIGRDHEAKDALDFLDDFIEDHNVVSCLRALRMLTARFAMTWLGTKSWSLKKER